MFIYNVKINGSKVFKIFFTCLVILIILILCIVSFKILSGAKNHKEISSCKPQADISKLTTSNYTNVLKAVHDNMDSYLGLKINFTRLCL